MTQPKELTVILTQTLNNDGTPTSKPPKHKLQLDDREMDEPNIIKALQELRKTASANSNPIDTPKSGSNKQEVQKDTNLAQQNDAKKKAEEEEAAKRAAATS